MTAYKFLSYHHLMRVNNHLNARVSTHAYVAKMYRWKNDLSHRTNERMPRVRAPLFVSTSPSLYKEQLTAEDEI